MLYRYPPPSIEAGSQRNSGGIATGQKDFGTGQLASPLPPSTSPSPFYPHYNMNCPPFRPASQQTWHDIGTLGSMPEVLTKEPRDSEPDDAQLDHTSAVKIWSQCRRQRSEYHLLRTVRPSSDISACLHPAVDGASGGVSWIDGHGGSQFVARVLQLPIEPSLAVPSTASTLNGRFCCS